jgi:hypothetical protein
MTIFLLITGWLAVIVGSYRIAVWALARTGNL